MRKWWWLGVVAIALMPQVFASAQEEKKGADEKAAAEKKSADEKAEAAKKAQQERVRANRERQAKEQKIYVELNKLVSDKKFEEAEKLLADTVKDNPNWLYKTTAHTTLAMAYSTAGDKAKAGEHALTVVSAQAESAKKNPALLGSVASTLGRLGPILKDAGKLDGIVADLEKSADSAAENKERRLSALAGKISLFKAIGRKDDADKIAADIDSETTASLKSEPKVAKRLIDRLDAIDQLSAHFAANKEKRAEFVKEKAELIKNGMTEFPKEVAIATRHFREELNQIGRFGSERLKEAEEKYEAIKSAVKDYIAALPDASAGASLSAMVDQGEGNLTRLRTHAPLIGQPAMPMDGEINAWVNGSVLTDADLKDKVVLVDFWAVWCGPCIMTFPHLIEWQEKYGDKGLVIVGVTSYSNDDWDENAKRSVRINKDERVLTPEEEQAAMAKFGTHHKLKHVFAVQNDSRKLTQFYKANAIPEAVLVGKDGKVKLIRVGASPENAHDLEAGIREALGLPAEETH